MKQVNAIVAGGGGASRCLLIPLLAICLLAVACSREPADEADTVASDADRPAAVPPQDPADTGSPAEPTGSPATTQPVADDAGPPAGAGVDSTIDIASLPGDPIDALESTASGLMFAVLEPGAGDSPAGPDTAVLVHYTGWHLDGKKFDASYDRGAPACFLLGGVIAGWTEGVGDMVVGERRKFVIPGELGYGEGGNPGAGIAPGEMLVFDVELLGLDPYTELLDVIPGGAISGDLVELDSGISYYVLEDGTGDAVVDEESVMRVSFMMWLNDGTELQGSGDEPRDMTHRGVFPGMMDAITGMKLGEHRKIVIPYDRAFGPRGRATSTVLIPPKAVVILDYKLEGIDPWVVLPDPLPGAEVTTDPIETDSGVIYYELAEGDGDVVESPRAEVTVKLQGWLVDGTPTRGEAGEELEVILNETEVAGWAPGLQGMRVGGHRKLVIPPDQAYGLYGRASIPPKATLIYDIELLSVTPLD